MTDLNVNWRIRFGNKTDYGIGSIGCGGIVEHAHLPAYQKAGFNVVAVFDLNRERAEKLAAAFGISRVYDSLDELLADPDIAIVDLAVPPAAQMGIVEQAAVAGKHMLCQKPLADSFENAVRIVELAEQAGVKQAVNQQMRWDAGMAASRDLINRGLIGQPTDAQIHVNVETPWHLWPWTNSVSRLEILVHSIHYLDTFRALFGEPEWVTSRHTRFPEQSPMQGETKTITILDYPDGLQAMAAVNHFNTQGAPFATYRFLGTEGVIEGTIGLLYDYPKGRPDTLLYTQKGEEPIAVELDETWIPDAFVGPMSNLMESIEKDRSPDTNGADNLNTLRIVFAAYLSAETNRSVKPSEIQG